MWSGFRSGLVLAVLGVALAVPVKASAQVAAGPLAGTLVLTAGTCDGGPADGSYFRMILPTGTRSGPFLENGDSACGDKTFTLLRPGADGGVRLGQHQPKPSPTFDGDGNARSDRVTEPTPFFGVDFATSTNATDPQTGADVVAPSLTLSADGSLSGDFRAFAASWNNQEFNQGAPKPDGSSPGNTAAPTGTLDPATGRFTLEWTSTIVGGPFDRFTGLWHLEGRLSGVATPDGGATAAPQTDGGGGTVPAATDVIAASGVTTTSSTVAAGAEQTGDESDESAAPQAIVSGGSEPSAALVVLIALFGLAAFGSFLLLDRRIRRMESGT